MNQESKNSQRLVFIDTLRGFTMFWIIGGGAIVASLAGATNWPVFKYLAAQMTHVSWNGFHFFDLIFPLFMFVSGLTVPYSIGNRIANGESKRKLIVKVIKRAFILVILGVLYNNKNSFDFSNLRYASVLGQIGIAYLIAVSIYMFCSKYGQYVVWASLLIGFWAAMVFIPVPGIGAGVLTPEGNLSGFIDRLLLPGVTFREYYDPQGLLLMISASSITLSGIFTGRLLVQKNKSDKFKVTAIAAGGVFLLIAGLFWGQWYPINKEIWSSSFNLLTIGISLLITSVFFYIIEMREMKSWCFPFIVIGLNSIGIYMANRIIDFTFTADFILKGIIDVSGDFSSFVLNVGILSLEWLLLYFLYVKKIFLKI